jgi:hypothetical protein
MVIWHGKQVVLYYLIRYIPLFSLNAYADRLWAVFDLGFANLLYVCD